METGLVGIHLYQIKYLIFITNKYIEKQLLITLKEFAIYRLQFRPSQPLHLLTISSNPANRPRTHWFHGFWELERAAPLG